MIRINPAADAGYYLKAENELGRIGTWGGEGARDLGLEGVGVDAFHKLMRNRTPSGEKLTQRDHPDRRTGIDVTFCEPKSASIAEQVLGDDRIAEVRRDSVARIMDQLVEPLAATREKRRFGLGHLTVTTANLAYKTFEHPLARPEGGEPDPAGHIHAVAVNATPHKGKWYALDMEPIKEAAPFLQAAWHNDYARGLKGLGYGIRPTKDAFEIEGISDATLRKYSKRTASIEKELADREKGITDRIGGFGPRDQAGAHERQEIDRLERKLARIKSPKGKAAIGAVIRQQKAPSYSREELHDGWRSRLTAAESRSLARVALDAHAHAGQEVPDHSAHHLARTLDALMERESRVTETHLLTETLKAGVGEVTLPGVRAALAETELLRVDVRGEATLQTWENRQKEADLLRVARNGGIVWTTGKPKPEAVQDASRRAGPNPAWVKDAGALPFAELHRRAMASESEGRTLVLQGLPPRNAPAGHPLTLLRRVAGMEPIDNTPAKGRKPAPRQAAQAWAEPVRRAFERLRRFAGWDRHREEASRHVDHERLAARERGFGR